jgi:hypothetical protein
MHEAIVRDAEVALGVYDAAVGRLVIDSREDASTRAATLMNFWARMESDESIGRIAMEPNRSRARYRHLAATSALAG